MKYTKNIEVNPDDKKEWVKFKDLKVGETYVVEQGTQCVELKISDSKAYNMLLDVIHNETHNLVYPVHYVLSVFER